MSEELCKDIIDDILIPAVFAQVSKAAAAGCVHVAFVVAGRVHLVVCTIVGAEEYGLALPQTVFAEELIIVVNGNNYAVDYRRLSLVSEVGRVLGAEAGAEADVVLVLFAVCEQLGYGLDLVIVVGVLSCPLSFCERHEAAVEREGLLKQSVLPQILGLGHHHDGCAEVSAGGLAADGDVVGISAEVGYVLVDPLEYLQYVEPCEVVCILVLVEALLVGVIIVVLKDAEVNAAQSAAAVGRSYYYDSRIVLHEVGPVAVYTAAHVGAAEYPHEYCSGSVLFNIPAGVDVYGQIEAVLIDACHAAGSRTGYKCFDRFCIRCFVGQHHRSLEQRSLGVLDTSPDVYSVVLLAKVIALPELCEDLSLASFEGGRESVRLFIFAHFSVDLSRSVSDDLAVGLETEACVSEDSLGAFNGVLDLVGGLVELHPVAVVLEVVVVLEHVHRGRAVVASVLHLNNTV